MVLNRSPEFCLKLTYRYLLKAGLSLVTPGVRPILPCGHNLNNLSRGLQGHALGLMVSDKKIFSCFSLYKPM